MSIRLRMSLLYTAILLLTLAVFSSALYVAQAQYSLNIIRQDLAESARKMEVAWTRFHREWPPPPPPQASQELGQYSAEAEQAVRVTVRGAASLDVVSMLDAEGEPLPRPEDVPQREVEAFSISDEGLAQIHNGQSWLTIDEGTDARWLTLNRPVMWNESIIGILQVSRPLADRDRSMRSLRTTLIAGTAAATIVAFGAGWFLSGTTLRPIQRITETAQQIGEARDLSSRVEHSGPNDEVGRLAKTFNSMLERLESAYQQIAHALQVQQDFVADVSHELRTPLTTIRGNLVLLQRDPPLPEEEQADVLEDLSQESERLSRLVNDLLTLARADAGRELLVGPTAIKPIVDEIRRHATVLAPTREIDIANPGELAVVANADALKQTLLILVDNAIKHGRGPIRLTLDEADRQVAIRVQDSGPGMPPELQGRIFDRFYRADTARATPGFGLGLAIARTLTETQHGTIEVESTLGQGSAFTVRLPAAS
ncbi:MAG: HAMP domain-containing histidine kinase [Anaerolineae bacterium]|nr:HAMP domain-containing histidine kinase [Anaerolineae bacterium]